MALKPKDRCKEGVECPCCRAQTNASVTKNMTIYVWCRNIIDQETGEYCGYNARLGRAASKAFIQHHNEKYGDQDDVRLSEERQEPEQPAGDKKPGIGHNGGPPLDDIEYPRQEPSFGERVAHFFTAD